MSGVLSFTYSLRFREAVLRRSNLIKDDPMHRLYGLENLAFNARRSFNTQRILNSEKMMHSIVHSFVLYTPFIKGRTTTTNSRFEYVLLVFLKISAVADKAFKIVHK